MWRSEVGLAQRAQFIWSKWCGVIHHQGLERPRRELSKTVRVCLPAKVPQGLLESLSLGDVESLIRGLRDLSNGPGSPLQPVRAWHCSQKYRFNSVHLYWRKLHSSQQLKNALISIWCSLHLFRLYFKSFQRLWRVEDLSVTLLSRYSIETRIQ